MEPILKRGEKRLKGRREKKRMGGEAPI